VATADKDLRLRLAPGVDLRALPITPEDAFVLSRLDGTSTEADIALATGLDPAVVRESLAKLARLGAVSTDAAPERPPAPRPVPSGSSGTFHVGPVVETRGDSSGHHPAAALYDPSELDETVDLDLVRKRRILDTYYRLEHISHYEILGVDAGADKKAIKAAYFEIVNLYHPDRYFGKNLGSFKPKLERLFARTTEAHDVLTRQASREEYDRYLASVRRTRALDQTLSDRGGHASELERLEREIQSQAQLEEKVRHSYPSPAMSRAGGPSIPPVRDKAPTPLESLPPRPTDPDARRRALAKKLGVSLPPPMRSAPPPATSVSTPASRETAQSDLKRRYEERVVELKRRQVEHYLTAAEKAEASKDLVSATNALRIAASLDPSDASLAERVKVLENRAAAGLADSYVEQAAYEEREGRWLEAAASYRRASRGKPTPRNLERVAYCLLTGKGDLREAADFAKRARDASPDDAAIRVTLGRIFLEAGMKQSAIAEFERAQQLAPKDDTIRDWLRRVRREP
jgi:curved DNA-binding protein CbpA